MMEWDGRGLVSTDWLAEHLNDPELRVFDATVHLIPVTPGPYRIESGRAGYEAAHIPGAAFIDLYRDLSDTAAPLPFTKPSTDQLATAFGLAGIAEGNRVVIYSTTTPMWATRVWWMLRASLTPKTGASDSEDQNQGENRERQACRTAVVVHHEGQLSWPDVSTSGLLEGIDRQAWDRYL